MNHYHIFNHAIGKENLFLDHGNYEFFLLKVRKYILPNSDMLAFCLMPNHFHILISTEAAMASISKQTTNLTISYAKSYNKLYKRKGGLFLRACKIKTLDTESSIRNSIMYIHRNPIHHGFDVDFGSWMYSSYNDICTDNTQFIAVAKTLSYFGDLVIFKNSHQEFKNKIY